MTKGWHCNGGGDDCGGTSEVHDIGAMTRGGLAVGRG